MKSNAIAWAALIVSGAAVVSSSGLMRTAPAKPDINPESLKYANALSESFENVAEFVKPSVVSIATKRKMVRGQNPLQRNPRGNRNGAPVPKNIDPGELQEMLKRFLPDDGGANIEPQQFGGVAQGTGSGVVFDDKGHILTNNHVVENSDEITVTFHDGEEAAATIVGTDPKSDIAVIKVATTAYRPAKRGNSEKLKVGEWVLAVGSPFGFEQSVTAGIISAMGRGEAGIIGQGSYEDFIQTDAAINPGNSGGPLLDVTGRWIGVNTAILNRATGAEGIGFAIPADRVRDMIGRTFKRRLVSGEWTGFDVDANKSGSPVVREVYATGPAGGSGLRTGDRILAIGGRPTPSLFEYRLAEVDVPAGTALRLRVTRGDEGERDVEVPLQASSADALAIAKARLGFVARDATAADARTLGLVPGGGVVITEVVPDGPADRVLLRPNDVMTGLSTFKVRSLEDLLFVLEMVQSKDTVAIQVRRLVQNRVGEVGIKSLTGTIVAD